METEEGNTIIHLVMKHSKITYPVVINRAYRNEKVTEETVPFGKKGL